MTRQTIFLLFAIIFLNACDSKKTIREQEEEIKSSSEIIQRETNHILALISRDMEEDSFNCAPWYYAALEIDSTIAAIIQQDTLTNEYILKHYPSLVKKICSYSHKSNGQETFFGNNAPIDLLALFDADSMEEGLSYAFAKHKLIRLNYEMQGFLLKRIHSINCYFDKHLDFNSIAVNSADSTYIFIHTGEELYNMDISFDIWDERDNPREQVALRLHNSGFKLKGGFISITTKRLSPAHYMISGNFRGRTQKDYRGGFSSTFKIE